MFNFFLGVIVTVAVLGLFPTLSAKAFALVAKGRAWIIKKLFHKE